VTVLVLLVTGLATWALFSPRRTEDQTYTYRQAIDQVELDTSEGDITVVAGEPGVAVVAQRLSWTSMARPAVDRSVTGERLAVAGECRGTGGPFRFGGHCAIGFTVQVPPEVTVKVHTGGGTVRIAGLTGEVRVTAATGDIQLDDLAGAVVVRADHSDVTATGLRAGAVDVRIQSGDLDLAFARPAPAVVVATRAGDVTLELAPGRYQVSARSDAGQETVEVPHDPGASSTVTARTGAGDVVIRYAD